MSTSVCSLEKDNMNLLIFWYDSYKKLPLQKIIATNL